MSFKSRNWNKGGRPLRCESLESRDAPAVLPAGSEFRVNAITAWQVDEPSVALDGDGDFVVVWQAFGADGSNNAVVGHRYSKDGTSLGSDFQVNTHTFGSQQHPQVASAPDGTFVVVWGSASSQDGSREGVYGRRFAANGQPLSGEFLINQFTLDIQGNAAIAMDGDGDFVVTWETTDQDGDGYAIYARRYNSAGEPLSNEFQVNTTTLGDQRYPAIAMTLNGEFIITWQNPDQDLDGIVARRFNSSGVPTSPEFQVNTTTADDQTRPQVAIADNGIATIIWESRVQDAGTSGIYVRQFDINGNGLGPELRVNTYTIGNQVAPRIADNAAGELIATWQSDWQDGNVGGIYAQRITASGQLSGLEMRVHTTTIGDQTRPTVASDIYGDFVVAWPSSNSPMDGILAQRYFRPPAPHAQVIIDDGHPQRSVIRSLTLEFNTLVTIGPSGLQLAGPQGLVALSLDYSASTPTQSIVRINLNGNNVTAGGLVNGDYTFVLFHEAITNINGETYDGDHDGDPGPTAVVHFHRFFGDVDGDRDVDADDFASFRTYFGLNSSQPQFRHYFDHDGDGDIDSDDFAEFRRYFGLQLP